MYFSYNFFSHGPSLTLIDNITRTSEKCIIDNITRTSVKCILFNHSLNSFTFVAQFQAILSLTEKCKM